MRRPLAAYPLPLLTLSPSLSPQGERNFYILDFPSDSPSVEISVVPDYGDPDMYIRLDDKVPNRDNAQYRSNSVAGEEVILIKKTDNAYKNSCAGKDRCHVYIAVYGYDNSQYTITAAKSDGITTLRENVPARENVDAGHYEYFKFTSTEHLNVLFSLTPLSGDPDLFVSTTVSHLAPRAADFLRLHTFPPLPSSFVLGFCSL